MVRALPSALTKTQNVTTIQIYFNHTKYTKRGHKKCVKKRRRKQSPSRVGGKDDVCRPLRSGSPMMPVWMNEKEIAKSESQLN